MAETPSKRLRQDPQAAEAFDFEDSNSKRHKPYHSILSLLEEEAENEEQNQDLSAMLTALQKELSASTAFEFDSPFLAAEDDGARRQQEAEEDEDVMSVMRHLLEASDDELGIPNYAEENNNNNNNYYNNNFVELKSEENISVNLLDNGLWEFEDVAANYYAVLQAELFL